MGMSVEASPLDLSGWSSYDWNLENSRTSSSWQVSEASDYFAYQFSNAGPSAYLDNSNWARYQVEGSFRVMNTGCFGVVGFVFGYQDPSHFYLFDWKRYNSEAVGKDGIGFAVKRFSAPSVSDLDLADFQSSKGTDNMETLVSSYGPYCRWSPFTTYHFSLDFQPGTFHIQISGVEPTPVLWEAEVDDSAYGFGRFGFYNFNQGAAMYYGFNYVGDPTPVPEPSTLLLLIGGLAALQALRRRSKK
jgi:hypothetical protein